MMKGEGKYRNIKETAPIQVTKPMKENEPPKGLQPLYPPRTSMPFDVEEAKKKELERQERHLKKMVTTKKMMNYCVIFYWNHNIYPTL